LTRWEHNWEMNWEVVMDPSMGTKDYISNTSWRQCRCDDDGNYDDDDDVDYDIQLYFDYGQKDNYLNKIYNIAVSYKIYSRYLT
jgi:hypothetical protein